MIRGVNTARKLRWPALAPGQRMTLGIVAWLVGAGLLLGYMLEQPWLGLRVAPGDATGLHVLKVVAGGPAALAGVSAGDTLVALGEGDDRIGLVPEDAVPAPDMLGTYASARAFYVRQGEVHALLRQPLLAVTLAEGRLVDLRPAPATPPSALPASFWFQVGVGSFCYLLGLGVWAFRPGSRAVFYYFVTGLGVALFVGVATLYVSRELAMPGELLWWAEKLNAFGVALFGWAFITTVCHFPRPLWPGQPVGLYTGAVLAALFAGNLFEVAESFAWGRNIPIALVCLLMLLFGSWHLHRLRGQPAEQALLRWYMTTWLLGSLLFLASYNLPLIFGLPPLIQKPWVYGLFALIYLGITVGITRYRVFDLDRWIFLCWMWFLGGVAVVLIDVALVAWLEVSGAAALGMALVVVGWLYFPMRQWMLSRIGKRAGGRTEAPFTDLLDAALASESIEDIGDAWRAKLREVFQPAILEATDAVSSSRLLDDGQRLRVPGFDRTPALELAYRNMGRALFTRADRDFADVAWRLFVRVAEFREAFDRGAQAERSRVARDLHDDVSAKLLGLLYRTERRAAQDVPRREVARLARDCLQELRTVIRGLEGRENTLATAAANWREEVCRRCADAGVRCDWKQSLPVDDPVLPVRHHINATAILREAVTNALKHAAPEMVSVRVRGADQSLLLEIRDNGTEVAADGCAGRGTRNMRERAREVDGTVDWTSPANPDGTGTLVRFVLPLQYPAAP